MAVPQTKSGSGISFKVNGVKVAYASGINITEDDTVLDIDVLDQIYVAELPYVAHKVNFTVNIFKVDSNAAESLGLRPSNIDAILSQATLTCEVFDRITNEVLYQMQGVVWTGGTGTVEARNVWTGTWNFRAQIGGQSM